MDYMIVEPKRVTRLFYIIIGLLTVLHVSDLVVYHWVGNTDVFDYIYIVDFDTEGNIPTLFSSLLFFINSVLLFFISRIAKKQSSSDSKQWLGLAIIFLFLCFDESIVIHEHSGDLLANYIDAYGFLYYPWFIPYMIAFFLLVLFYLPFYFKLNKETKVSFFIAASMFITGAAGLDILGANEDYHNGSNTIVYAILYTLEELMEMIAQVIFMSALLRIIEQSAITIKLEH